MMGGRWRGVLAGLGNHGRRWAEVCRRHPAVELVGFAGRGATSRQRAATDWGVPGERIYGALGDAIAGTAPDFVLDVTSPESHREVALASFRAGLPLLQAKPMSDHYRGAAAIVAAGERAGCIHMIDQNMRFSALPRLTRKLFDGGAIGAPGQLDIVFAKPWADYPGTHYVTEPWMFLLDMGCHHFDMLRYVVGAEPEAVRVVSWNPAWGWHAGDASHVAVFEFPGGLVAVHRASGCSTGAATPWHGAWRIEGPEGSITWEEERVFVTREHRTDQPRRDEIAAPEPAARSGPEAVLDEFLAALAERREPECSGRDNLGTMAMTFAAVRSARQGGRRVRLTEITEAAPGP
ncbi:MAG: Gfo/Idh/MocA family oxidoreductase [Spirochaetaceae bacterium]|nr:Gfo/Idh/MocA family oxidoreductase [Spirochaetaceae bacterium]